MQLAHKIELNPNNKQKTYFKKACGIARFAWNWGLCEWNRQYAENKKQKFPLHKISGLELKKQFNAIKKKEFPWTKEVTKYAAQQPFIQLQKAWTKYFKEKKAGRPKLKKKFRSTDSFYVGGDQIKVKNKKIWVPNLGLVRLREPLRFKGKINSATFSRRADRWFVSLQVETDEKFSSPVERAVGIDLGINKLATFSDGLAVESPKPLKKNLYKLKRAQRVLSKQVCTAKKNKKKLADSKNFQKQKLKVARIHSKIANIRKDTLHKVTSFIIKNYSHIGIEDLNVSGMVKNHNLARAINDIGFYEFKRQLEYKSKMNGNHLFIADRFFPSSKKCSVCDEVKKDLKLSDRVFRCSCGHLIDRDLNAAINIKNLIDYYVRQALPKLKPVEIAAMLQSVFPVKVTSIVESGSEYLPV